MLNIEKFADDVKACRYCFMCRHLAAVSNVSFRESDTPRGRALIASYALSGQPVWEDPDYVDSFYRADLSGANRFHCVNHYDEVGIVLAMRRDIVAAGKAPAKVAALAAELTATPITAAGQGEIVYIATGVKPADDAFGKIMKKAKLEFQTVTGAESCKALKVLGFEKAANDAFAKLKTVLGKAKTVVCGSTAVYDALQNDFPGFQKVAKALPEFLAGLNLEVKTGGSVAYLASDFIKNYHDNCPCAQQLLAKLGVTDLGFGTNVEESYSAGEGAVVLDRLNPELAQALAKKIVAQAPAGVRLVCGSAYTALALVQAGGDAVCLAGFMAERI